MKPDQDAVGVREQFEDQFKGDTAALLGSIDALLDLDERGALVPHGIGGHARALLKAAASRLETAQGERDEAVKALKPFADAYEFWNAADGGVHDDNEIDDQGKITIGDCRQAAEARLSEALASPLSGGGNSSSRTNSGGTASPKSDEQQALEGAWRPIETAPRDRFVLLFTPASEEFVGFVAMAKWQGGSWFGIDDEGLTFNPLQAWDRVTHWQPLPSPPNEAAKALGGAS